MPVRKVHKEEIVLRAELLFKMQGYHRTSMQDVADAVGILKGSLYHHFSGKQALMEAVLQSGRQAFREDILAHAHDRTQSPRDRMQTLFEQVKAHYLTDEGGCIMGNIGLETSTTMPSFRAIICGFFDDWIDAFAAVFGEQYPEQDARIRAEQSVEELEGAIMLCRVFQDDTYVERAMERVLERL